MHGVQRRVKTDDERERERVQKELARCKRYRVAGASLRSFREQSLAKGDEGSSGDVAEAVRNGLQRSQRVLELNTEHYTAWNVRRQLLLRLESNQTGEATGHVEGSPLKTLLSEELGLLERTIASNPKSYWSWLHRRWCTERAYGDNAEGWARELKLCDRLLSLDERNFHCWGYRRFAAAHLIDALGEEAEPAILAEFAFTTKKIEDNFSNYSAWHQRSALLLSRYTASPQAESDEGSTPSTMPADVLDSEFELVQNAFYTEPNDSAAWFYHHWLLGQVRGKPDHALAVVDRELRVCKELLDLEPDSKWPMLTIVRLLVRRLELTSDSGSDAEEGTRLLDQLATLDAARREHYLDMRSRFSA